MSSWIFLSINLVPLESSILSKQSSIVEANAKSQLSSKSRLQKVPLMSLTDEGIILIFDKSNVTLVLSSKVFRFTIPLIISKNPISSLMSRSFALKIVISCSWFGPKFDLFKLKIQTLSRMKSKASNRQRPHFGGGQRFRQSEMSLWNLPQIGMRNINLL